MKKLIIKIISNILSLSILFCTVYAAKNEEKIKVPLYEFTAPAYDAFLNDIEDETVFQRNDVEYKEKKEHASLWNKPLSKFLIDKNSIQEYVNSQENGIEIYDYRIILFMPKELHNYGFYVPATIWLKTNKGIRIIAFDEKISFREEYLSTIEYTLLFDERYCFIYYKDTSRYVERYKERHPEIYINGIKQETEDKKVRNEEYVVSIRPFFEALGIKMKWNEIYSTFTLAKGDKIYHTVVYRIYDENDPQFDYYYRKDKWHCVIFDNKNYQTFCRFLIARDIIPNHVSEEKKGMYWEDIDKKALHIVDEIAILENKILMPRVDVERMLYFMFGIELQTKLDTETNILYVNSINN